MHPKLGKYVLLGDSQFVRLAKNCLSYQRCRGRNIGFCKSGQTVSDLLQLVQNSRSLPEFVILLIGTNDIKNSEESSSFICAQYDRLIVTMKDKGCKEIIVCTIPPILFLQNNSAIRAKLKSVNTRIQAKAVDPSLSVCNLYKLFFKRAGHIRGELFQRKYHDGRPDNIHWNLKGMELAQQALLDHIHQIEVQKQEATLQHNPDH